MPYPDQHELIQDLVANDHVALEDEPLLVAIYYASDIAPQEECLFEVVRHFGFDEPSDDSRIFQIQFGPSPGFPLPDGDLLRLFLTNPVEFRKATADGWPEILDLRRAITDGRAEVLYCREGDQEAAEIRDRLQPQAVPTAA